MKKILYIHGLSSSGASSTVLALKKLLGDVAKIIAPDMPMDVKEASQLIKEVCDTEKPDLIIGSSLGAMLAQLTRGQKKILVNPSFEPSLVLRQNMGEQIYFNKRKDGATMFNITEEICVGYEEAQKTQFDNISEFDVENTYGLFADNDAVVNCKDTYTKHYKNIIDFEGEHRLTYSNVKNTITPLVAKLLNIVVKKED